ncbi:CoA transferase [Nocardia gipuzkoensis]|jgi:hypothetical protein
MSISNVESIRSSGERLDEDRFKDPAARAQHQAELAAVIEETTRTLSKMDLYHRALVRGIPAGHVATMTDLLTSPQARPRRRFNDDEYPSRDNPSRVFSSLEGVWSPPRKRLRRAGIGRGARSRRRDPCIGAQPHVRAAAGPRRCLADSPDGMVSRRFPAGRGQRVIMVPT